MAATTLFPIISDDLTEVDSTIRKHLRSEVVLVNSVADYIVQGGGKRLRPVLLILFAKALGYQGSHHHLLSAVVELIHTATLLHDDVVDESPLRRGRATANAGFGNAAAVLVGDFLYSRAFQMMVIPNDLRVMQILSDATNVIAEGEVLQLMNISDPDVDEARYMQVIRFKTAKLFEAAAQLGALLSGATAMQLDKAADYGRSLGTAFQIVDDVLDYAGNSSDTGKSVGNDLLEGKPTLPLIHVIRSGTQEESELARLAISEGGTDQIAPILAAIERNGSLAYARSVAELEASRARACLVDFPRNQFTDALDDLTRLAVDRTS